MSNEELAERIQKGETKCIPLLWDQVQRLIYWKAHRFYRAHYERCTQYGVTIEDFTQEGYFAFLQAVKAYNPQSGYTFSTFLSYPLKNAFHDMIGLRTNKKWHDPLSHSVSLSAPTADDDSIELSDAIPDEQAEEALEAVETSDYIGRLRQDIDTVLGRLNEDERRAITSIFFCNMTAKEAAAPLGVDSYKIRSLEASALRKIRNPAIGKELRKYREDIISRYGYRGGWSNYRHTWTSSTERAALKIMEREQ